MGVRSFSPVLVIFADNPIPTGPVWQASKVSYFLLNRAGVVKSFPLNLVDSQPFWP